MQLIYFDILMLFPWLVLVHWFDKMPFYLFNALTRETTVIEEKSTGIVMWFVAFISIYYIVCVWKKKFDPDLRIYRIFLPLKLNCVILLNTVSKVNDHCSKFLKRCYTSFVWVWNFSNRKNENGYCILWNVYQFILYRVKSVQILIMLMVLQSTITLHSLRVYIFYCPLTRESENISFCYS